MNADEIRAAEAERDRLLRINNEPIRPYAPAMIPEDPRAVKVIADMQKELDSLKLQIDALRTALFAECRGIACDREGCYVGYRSCSGCEARAKAAFGPGWNDFTINQNHGRVICGWCAGTGKEGSQEFGVPCRKCLGSGDPTKPTPGIQS